MGPAHAGAGQLEGVEAGLEAADCSVLASRCSSEGNAATCHVSCSVLPAKEEDNSTMLLPSHLIRKCCVHHSSNSLLCRAASTTPAGRSLQVACWSSRTALSRLKGAQFTTLLVLLPDAMPNAAAAAPAPARPGCPSAQPGWQPTGGHRQQLPGLPEHAVPHCCRIGTGLAHMMACTRAHGRHSGEYHQHSTKIQSTLTHSVPCRSSGSRGKPRRKQMAVPKNTLTACVTWLHEHVQLR